MSHKKVDILHFDPSKNLPEKHEVQLLGEFSVHVKQVASHVRHIGGFAYPSSVEHVEDDVGQDARKFFNQ